MKAAGNTFLVFLKEKRYGDKLLKECANQETNSGQLLGRQLCHHYTISPYPENMGIETLNLACYADALPSELIPLAVYLTVMFFLHHIKVRTKSLQNFIMF
jgi:hypothetical protein